MQSNTLELLIKTIKSKKCIHKEYCSRNVFDLKKCVYEKPECFMKKFYDDYKEFFYSIGRKQ